MISILTDRKVRIAGQNSSLDGDDYSGANAKKGATKAKLQRGLKAAKDSGLLSAAANTLIGTAGRPAPGKALVKAPPVKPKPKQAGMSTGVKVAIGLAVAVGLFFGIRAIVKHKK